MAPSHLLFLLLPLLFSMAPSEATCSTSRCSPSEVPVHFPFSLKGDQERCGYPGFELSCDGLNRTVVHIESWGEFLVRDISYDTQEIQIYDQHSCLLRRLLLLNMSLPGSPFGYNEYLPFSFYNCPANSTIGFLEPIACLSTTNYTIFAAPSYSRSVRSLLVSCDLFASAMVPVQWMGYGYEYVTDVNDGVSLGWDVPNCHECIARGGRCGFKNRRSNEIECFGLATKRGLSSTVKYALSVGLGIPIFVSIILITSYLWGRFKSNGTTNHHHRHHESAVLPQPAVFVMGLNEAVIQSYPMTVLGESRRLIKPEDNICSICLSEYRPKDTLRTIPSCEHCFLAGCIDKWLRRNGACPLCRDFPKPALPSAV